MIVMLLRFKLPILLVILVFGLALMPAAAQDSTPGGVMPTPGAVATVTTTPRPLPASTLTEDRTTLETYFAALDQGQTGLLHVTGQGIAGARARFLDRLIDFFPMPDDGFYGFIAVSMEQTPRKYDLDIFVWFDDESRQTIHTQVEVDTGDFIRQDVTIGQDKAYLVDPEIERDELARLQSIFGTVTLEKLWDSQGFQLPIPGEELTSPFGAFRTFNQTMQTRHTGWDLHATLGQPVMASAAGRVAYTGLLDIHGSFVAIDHGYGVYSAYSHFSQVHVTQGQTIAQGQVLGLVGNTGRTSGPHFHWEVAVNDTFVDAEQFITMWKPG